MITYWNNTEESDDWIKSRPGYKDELKLHRSITTKGGKGSGFFGHAGIPGHHGGSAASKRIDPGEAEFKKWFDGSKVVDANGKPLVVYKGMYPYDYSKTPETEITSINRPEPFPMFGGSADEKPFYIAGFFGDRETANRFAEGIGMQSAVYPVYLRLQNPIIFDAENKRPSGYYQFGASGREFRDAMRSSEYDGAIIKNTTDEGTVYVAKHPNQIKSIYNRGTYQDDELLKERTSRTTKGGPGSGNFGHSGIPGHWGGSAPASGALAGLSFINDAEREIAQDAEREHLLVFDGNDVIFSKVGRPGKVDVAHEERSILKGKVVTHNHPPPYTSFSEDDILFAMQCNIPTIRVVTPDVIYSFTNNSITNFYQHYWYLYQVCKKSVLQQLKKLYVGGKIEKEQAIRIALGEILFKFAKESKGACEYREYDLNTGEIKDSVIEQLLPQSKKKKEERNGDEFLKELVAFIEEQKKKSLKLK